jgi:hypothetical protein
MPREITPMCNRLTRNLVAAAALLSVSLALTATAEDVPMTVDPNDYSETPALWACGAQDWGPWFATTVGTTDQVAAGKYAVLLNYCSGAEHFLAFPKFRNAGWDLSAVEYLEFKVKLPQGITRSVHSPTIYLRSQDGSFVRIRPEGRNSLFTKPSDGEWQQVRVPLTPDEKWEQFVWLGGSLKNVDFFEIAFFGPNTPRFAAHYVMVDDVRFGPTQPDYTPPNPKAADLNVLVIERTPIYERYVLPPYDGIDFPTCSNKDAKHYPDPGEEVTFTARVQNKGKTPAGGQYVWLLDGKEVGRGKLDTLKPAETAEFTLPWAWDPADHDVTFKVAPGADDYCARNNELTVRTNALQLIYFLERGTQAQLEQKTNYFGSYSLEDWLQAQTYFMNQLFAESKYDFAPEGITARVAINKFVYVDDGYIRDNCSWGPALLGEQNPQWDGGRGCTQITPFWDNGDQGATFLNIENMLGRPDDCWMHEMSHQIGLIDDYQFITEPEDNAVNGVGFNYANRGLMGGGEIDPYQNPGTLYSLYAPGDVHGLNVTKGKRRGYFGEYLYCVPANNALVIVDESGAPVANATINVYQTQGRKIDTTPEHSGTTDAKGRFALANRPVKGGVTETGCELRDNPFGPIHVVGFNGVFLIVTKTPDGQEKYGFTTVQEFNLAWAAGHKDQADITVVVKEKTGKEREVYTAPRPKTAADAQARP